MSNDVIAPDHDTTTATTCPNCGNTTFSEDGDCTKCREPAVVGAAVEATR